MGAEHAFVFGEMEDVEVIGVFSRSEPRAAAGAAACGAVAFTDAAALIGRDDIDAIDVCVPSDHHAPFVLAALAAGKHVFCETPLALRLDEARAMRRAAREAGRLLQVGLLMRSVAPYQHVKALADSADHGGLLSLSAYRLGNYLRPGSPEHKTHYSDPSTELMTFDFDFANWLFGRPARVSATSADEAERRSGRDIRTADLRRRPLRHDAGKWTDAGRLPVHGWLPGPLRGRGHRAAQHLPGGRTAAQHVHGERRRLAAN
jgi:predicted dehydrogenase